MAYLREMFIWIRMIQGYVYYTWLSPTPTPNNITRLNIKLASVYFWCLFSLASGALLSKISYKSLNSAM